MAQDWGVQMRGYIVRKNEWIYLTFLPFATVEPPPPGRNTDVLDRWSDLTRRSLVIKLTRLFRL